MEQSRETAAQLLAAAATGPAIRHWARVDQWAPPGSLFIYEHDGTAHLIDLSATHAALLTWTAVNPKGEQPKQLPAQRDYDTTDVLVDTIMQIAVFGHVIHHPRPNA